MGVVAGPEQLLTGWAVIPYGLAHYHGSPYYKRSLATAVVQREELEKVFKANPKEMIWSQITSRGADYAHVYWDLSFC